MTETAAHSQSRAGRLGWRILIVVGALIGLNGISWFFVGPGAVTSLISEHLGISANEFENTYPDAVTQIRAEARWIAVYLTAIGTMGFLAARTGRRLLARWTWHITWVMVVTPIAIALVGTLEFGGDALRSGFALGMLSLGIIALIGQVLARPSRVGEQ